MQIRGGILPPCFIVYEAGVLRSISQEVIELF